MSLNIPRATVTLAVLALVLAAPLVTARDTPLVMQVTNDVFDVVDVENMTFAGACGGGEFEVMPDGNGFRFYEVSESTFSGVDQIDQVNPVPQGYAATGCGRATYPLRVPVGIDHFHVRFNATRTIDEAQTASPNEPGVEAEQSLVLRDGSGLELEVRHYFDPFAKSNDLTYVDPLAFDPVAGEDAVVEWYFEDRAHVSQNFPDAYSGTDFQATVTDAIIEYSYLPADNFTVLESSAQSGTDVVNQAVVVSSLEPDTFDRFDRINVRVQTEGVPDLVQVILPDGTILEETTTRGNSGPMGYDPNQVLVEHAGDNSWFTIPYGIVAEQGPGDYTFVIQESQGLTVSGGLVPVAVVIGVLPFVASAFAIRGTLRFRREAFGGFQRAATWLVASIGALLAYYVAVMGSAFATGAIKRMIILPFDVVAWLLYLQVAIAAIGFVVVFVVGRELYRITVPRSPE